jgi:hypothetical protein
LIFKKKKKLEQVEKKKSTQMTRTESSRSDQKVLCATAPWERDGEGKEKRRGRKSGREKKESESGDFLPVLCVLVTDFLSLTI